MEDRTCGHCEQALPASKRRQAKWCSSTCRDRARRLRERGGLPVPPVSAEHRHNQLRDRYGAAKQHGCAICGKVSNGNVWAYRHSSYEAICQYRGQHRGQVYSLDDADYWVLCRSDHLKWDIKHAKTVPTGMLSGPHVAFAMALDIDYAS